MKLTNAQHHVVQILHSFTQTGQKWNR